MKKLILIIALCLIPIFARGQAVVLPFNAGHYQFLDTNGIPLASGCLFQYASGSTTPQATYTDSSGNTQNSQPITLSSSGFADIWPDVTKTYKFKLVSAGGTNCSTGVTQWTVDNIPGGQTHLFSADGTCSSTGIGFVSESTTGLIRSTTGVMDYCSAGTDVIKFTGSAILPATAGGATIGGASRPFSSVYIGAAATNNAQITGTFAAANVWTIPDANGSETFVGLGVVQTLANKSFKANTVSFVDPTDVTKKSGFSLSAMTTGKTMTFLGACALDCTFTLPGATDTLVGTGATQTLLTKTLTAPTLTNPVINSGVGQGSGHKHQRFGGLCTTGASAGNTCTTAVTWTVAFADANYTLNCTGVTQTNVPSISVESIAGAGFTIRLSAITAAAATFAAADCQADHD